MVAFDMTSSKLTACAALISVFVILVCFTQNSEYDRAVILSSGEASVGEQDLAHSILTSAKKRFISGKQPVVRHKEHKSKASEVDGFVLDKRASAVLNSKSPHHHASGIQFSKDGKAPDSSLLKRMPAYITQGKEATAKRKESARQKLEAKIAAHKLTTRGLVKAVQAAEQAHFKELNQDLKDQTDDLIIAKINEITKKHKGGVNDYVLNNALTPQERKELALKKQGLQTSAVTSNSNSRRRYQAQARLQAHARLQRKNPAILRSTGGAKGGNPESMLSSYDRQLLANGPSSLDDTSPSSSTSLSAAPRSQPPGYITPGGAPMLSQVPEGASQEWTPAAPQQPQPYPYYPPTAYAAAPQQRPSRYQYGYRPAMGPPPSAPYPALSQYGPYAAPQPYQPPQRGYLPTPPTPYTPYQYATTYQAQPYAAPMPQTLAAERGYAQPAYEAYPQPSPYAPQYQPAQYQAPPQQTYNTPTLAYSPRPQPPPYAPPAPAVGGGGGDGGGGGGRLWKLFSSSDSPSSPPNDSAGLLSGGGAGDDSSSSSSSSALSLPTPPSIGKGVAGAGSGIAAQMAALRASILADYKSTIHVGQKAGYLPPPP